MSEHLIPKDLQLDYAFACGVLKYLEEKALLQERTPEDQIRWMSAMREKSRDERIAKAEAELVLAKEDRNTYDSAHKIQAAATLRAEAENKALREKVARLEEAVEKMRTFAVYGCGTKQKDARGRQFAVIIDIASTVQSIASRASASATATTQKGE